MCNGEDSEPRHHHFEKKSHETVETQCYCSFYLLHIRWDMLQHVATAISGFRQILPSQKFVFVKRDDKGGITTWKDLESSRLAR